MAVVQFDVDGVVANFTDGYVAAYERLHSERFPLPLPPARWDDFWDKAVWSEIKASSSFWVGLAPLVDSKVFKRIEVMQDQHATYFVTNRPGRYVKWQSESWLRYHGISNPTVVVSAKKGEVARAIGATHAIDDKAGNAVYTAYESPETRSFLIDRSYNRFDHAVLGSKVTRVDSVSEFLDEVEAA